MAAAFAAFDHPTYQKNMSHPHVEDSVIMVCLESATASRASINHMGFFCECRPRQGVVIL